MYLFQRTKSSKRGKSVSTRSKVEQRYVGSIDVQSTIKKRKKFDCQKRSLSTEKNTSLSDDISNLNEDITPSNNIENSSDKEMFDSLSSLRCNHNYTPIPSVAKICDRYNVSNTIGADVATATLVHFGLISNDNNDKVIDRSKLWRERKKSPRIHSTEKIVQ